MEGEGKEEGREVGERVREMVDMRGKWKERGRKGGGREEEGRRDYDGARKRERWEREGNTAAWLHTHLQWVQHAFPSDDNLLGLLFDWQGADESGHLLSRLPLG